MAIDGDGTYMVTVLWSLTALVLVFLVLRAYVRIVCVTSYGIDDHLYWITCALVILSSSTMHVAAAHGYGQVSIDRDARAAANYWRTIGQTFSTLATGTSKACIGFFLLRITVARWQRIAIWFFVVFIAAVSLAATIFPWAACQPAAYIWDERIDGGTCLDTVPLSMALAASIIGVDTFFVLLPWIFIWNITAPRWEKMMVVGSLSLGIIAIAAGVKRLMEIKSVHDVPVGLIVWSQTEIVVTLVCVAIPNCRPLWARIFEKHVTSGGSNGPLDQGTHKENTPQHNDVFIVGGNAMSGARASEDSKEKSNVSSFRPKFTSVSTPNILYGNIIDSQTNQLMVERNGNSKNGSAKDSDCGVEEEEEVDPWIRVVKRSWIVGQPLSWNEIMSHGPNREHEEEGIFTTKSYEVKSSGSTV